MSGDSSPSDDGKLPEAKEGKSDDVFEVEQILGHKLEDETMFLLVRWAGYGPDEDTWEPEYDLIETAGQAVKEYYIKQNVANSEGLHAATSKKTKKKENERKKAAKKRSREETPDDSEYSDGSFTDTKTPTKKQKRGRKPNAQKSLKSPTVPTKAALKSYESPSVAVAPNNAKKAAWEVREGRWFEESSDDDGDVQPESDIDKVLSKVKGKNKVVETIVEKSAPVRSKSPSPRPSSSSIVASATINKLLKQNGSKEPSLSRQRSLAPPIQEKKDDEPLWVVSGIARHVDEKNGRTKIILMKNTTTGDQKVLAPRDAFELSSWAVTKYLLDRCEF